MAPGRCAGQQHWEVIECISSDSTGEGRVRWVAEPHPGAGCGSSLVEPPTAGGQAQHVPSHPSVPEHTAMFHSPSPGPALPRLVCPYWPGLAPGSLLLPSPCSLRDPELVELPCRARELWCPGTPVWPCAAQGGRQFRLDAISTTEYTFICPAGSTAPLQSNYLPVGSSGSPVPLDQWSVIA